VSDSNQPSLKTNVNFGDEERRSVDPHDNHLQ